MSPLFFFFFSCFMNCHSALPHLECPAFSAFARYPAFWASFLGEAHGGPSKLTAVRSSGLETKHGVPSNVKLCFLSCPHINFFRLFDLSLNFFMHLPTKCH